MKTWTRDEIDKILESDDRAVERAIIRLFELQTVDEKRSSMTHLNNNMGFSSSWARNGTYYAKWILSGRRLTGKFLQKARVCALLHSRQLVDIANENEKNRDAAAFAMIVAS